jgi:OOP family OmpA-OmpF porin
MSIKRVSLLLVALAAGGATVAGAAGPQIRSTRSDATVASQRDLAEGRARVTVLDSRREPVLGLTTRDFSVNRDGTAGRIVSVEPVDQNVDAPRHVVVVMDNSYSMEERGVIRKSLDKTITVLKASRPIDDVQVVVYRDGRTIKMGDRALHVEYSKSNPSQLEGFATAACQRKSVTDNTYLYEAIVAGLELLRATPADGPRILWIVSDGEELNSAFKSDVVVDAAKRVDNLRVYAIDCMPNPKLDEFMAALATQNRGQARKAGQEADLLALYQQAGTRKEHYYNVSYDFPAPAPSEAAAPSTASVGKPMVFEGSVLFDFDKSELKPEGKEQLKAYREKVRAEMGSASTVAVTGYTDSVGTDAYNQKLSVRRAESVRAYLISLGVDPAKLKVAGLGESNPIADNATAAGRAKNRRVEIEVIGTSK